MSAVDLRRLADLPAFLTVPEAAVFLRLGRSAAYEAVARGEIPSVRFGAKLRIPRGALLRLACEQAVSNAGEPGPELREPAGGGTADPTATEP